MTAAALPALPAMTRRPRRATPVRSTIFGDFDVMPDRVVRFDDGLFGFRDCRAFAFVQTARQDAWWLQSMENPSLAFLLVDPFRIAPGFSVELGDADLRSLDAPALGDVAVLAIATLPTETGERATANLQGPLAVNLRTGRGRQLAMSTSAFGTRHPFDFPAAS